jgi:hypothetical protein
MKITNQHNLPEVVFNALTFSDYTKGDSLLSVTQLIDSPRVSQLQRQHDDEIEQDAVDFLWSRFGTSVHQMFEAAVHGADCISEERLFAEVNGWKISGAIDLQHLTHDGVIVSDYKVTSVWSVINDKQEWHKQLNCYAWMVRHAKQLPVKQLRIIAILRDWSRRKAEEGGNYPDSPIQMITIPMWSESDQDNYVQERVALHQEADFEFATGGELPKCDAHERWDKPTVFAVQKKGRVRAIKLHTVEDDAVAHAESLGTGHFVDKRTGESTRCLQNWCRVNEWCEQWKESKREKANQK